MLLVARYEGSRIAFRFVPPTNSHDSASNEAV